MYISRKALWLIIQMIRGFIDYMYMYEDQVFKYVSQAGELKNSRISFEIIKLLFKELNFIYSKKATKFCEISTLL